MKRGLDGFAVDRGIGHATRVPQQRRGGAEEQRREDVVARRTPTLRGATVGQQRAAGADERSDVGAVPPHVPVDRRGLWLRRHGLLAEILLSVSVALGLAFTYDVRHAPLLLTIALWAMSTYHSGRAVTSPLSRQLMHTAHSVTPALAFAGIYVGYTDAGEPLLRAAVVSVLAATAISTGCRLLRWRLQSPVRVVLVGDRMGVAQELDRFLQAPECAVVGVVVVEADIESDDVGPDLFQGLPVVCGIDAVGEFAVTRKADLVAVAPGLGFTSTDLRRMHQEIQDAPVAVGVLGVLDCVAPHRVKSGWMASSTIIDVRAPVPSSWVQLVKSALDRATAALLLALVSPLLLVLAIAIKTESRGPALFAQTRVGRGGQLFSVYKLRTMCSDAEERKAELQSDPTPSPLFKKREDPRVTRVGRLLRRYSLDEIPQLINVVRGEMSLVGPRPHLPEEIASMGEEERRRLAVLPGITGLWQVSGRSDLPGDKAAWLDTYYADNWSLSGDAKILLKTVPAVFKGTGAY